jgi:hypothetical protein
MNNPAATPRQRVKAARIASRYKHAYATSVPNAPTVIVVDDKFGFKVDPEVARAERDDRLREEMLGATRHTRKAGSEEEKAANREWWEIRRRGAERSVLLKYSPAYTADDVKKDTDRLKEFSRRRAERKKLTPEQDAEETHLAARVASYQSKPERLARYKLNAAEDNELQELRGLYREIAAEIDKMDLLYSREFDREVEIAGKAGLDFGAALVAASNACVRLKRPGFSYPMELLSLDIVQTIREAREDRNRSRAARRVLPTVE